MRRPYDDDCPSEQGRRSVVQWHVEVLSHIDGERTTVKRTGVLGGVCSVGGLDQNVNGCGTVRTRDGEECAEGAEEATTVESGHGGRALATKTTTTPLGVAVGPSIRSLGLCWVRTVRFLLFGGDISGPRVGFGPMNYLCVMFDQIGAFFYEVEDSLSKRSGVDDPGFFYGREKRLYIVSLGFYLVGNGLGIYFADDPLDGIGDHEADADLVGHGEDGNDGGQDCLLILLEFVVAENPGKIPVADVRRKHCLKKQETDSEKRLFFTPRMAERISRKAMRNPMKRLLTIAAFLDFPRRFFFFLAMVPTPFREKTAESYVNTRCSKDP